MIVGEEIISRRLLDKYDRKNLKNATYDLTVGEIIPIGSQSVMARREKPPKSYFMAPREMLFVMSKEEFHLPKTVTGVATLRTTFTKKGLVALNVGVVDAGFSGPISTSLINFSDRPVEISLNEKFFRVLFFEHGDISEYGPSRDESIHKSEYIQELEQKAYGDFSRTYLDVPMNDSDYFARTFWRMLFHGLTHGWGRVAGVFLVVSSRMIT